MNFSSKIILPAYAAHTLELLERGGQEAWCVGGCVRDSLLGRDPTDWDIASSATPEEAKACFQGYRIVDIGLKHGTVTVWIDGYPVEITTFRSDGDYTDHRHPNQVHFSRNLDDDLSRRDFTINALAYHPCHGLKDAFGGLGDLRAGVLRCVGEPKRRFEEDALRILRCLRFASTLGFSIEEKTGAAALEQQELLSAVSRERVREELTKLLCGQNAGTVLRSYAPIIFATLPELEPMRGCGQENPYHCYDVWEHTLHAVDAVPADKVLRWAAFLHDCGKPGVKMRSPDGMAHFYQHEAESVKLGGQILESLRFSSRETEEILKLVKYHGEIHPMPEKRIKKLLGKLGETQVFKLFQLSKADLAAQSPYLHEKRLAAIMESEALTREILSRGECLSLQDLVVNGTDLLQLGFSPGPALGLTLRQLLDMVLDGTLPNERDNLLQQAKRCLERERDNH